MTNSLTTELREKLTERGVEWRDESNGYANVTMFTANGVDWCFITRNYSNSNTTLRAEHITPEQAIAATLGNYEIVRCRDCKYGIDSGKYCAEGCADSWDWRNVEPDGFCAWGERKEVDE